MELSTHRRIPALGIAGLLTLATLGVTTGPAHASRLPADPITFVGTPAPMARFVIDAQAAQVWAVLKDLHSS